MMLNIFKIKRWAGIFVACFLPAISFYIGMMYGLLFGIGAFFISSIISIFASSMLLRNPFTQMLEGKGLLTLKIDSTGVIQPFIMSLHQPYVKSILNREKIDDVYDRETVLSTSPPLKMGEVKINSETNEIDIKLKTNEFNRARFQMFQYPTLIYNAQLKSLVTKEFISSREKEAFAEHGILYLNRKMEELTSQIRDFGRYIVEMTKPKTSLLKSKWIWIIIIGLMVFVAVMLGYPLIKEFMASSGIGNVFSGVTNNPNPVVPR